MGHEPSLTPLSDPPMLADDPRTPEGLAPIQPEERIDTLDILRGFALLGIMIINMPGFNYPWAKMGGGVEPFPSWYDQTAWFLVDLFGSGKFNSIFSFLFGLGFAIQIDRAESRGLPIAVTYLRRLLVLGVFGVLHSLLLWDGDVLHIYAAIGVALLLVRNLRDRWLWTIAAILVVAPLIRGGILLARNDPNPHPPSFWLERGRQQMQIYAHGSYRAMILDRAEVFRMSYLEKGAGWFATMLGTTMIVGFIAGRRRVFANLPSNLGWIRRMTGWAGAVGIPSALAFAYCSLKAEHGTGRPTLLGMMTGLFYVIHRPPLFLFYVGGITLLAQTNAGRRWFAPLRSVGRMPLTNYLMQSLIAGFVFNSYGLGYYGQVGPALGVLISVTIYAVQVVYSNLWMSQFRFGPMEWLWRFLTYGKPPAMRSPQPRASLL